MAKRPSRETGDFSHPAMNYKPPKELQRFRAGLFVLVGTLVVLGLWTGGWFIAQALVNSALTDWQDKQRANGAQVSYESLNLSGYPFQIVIDLKAPKYDGPLMGEPVAWQGESLTLKARPWSPSTLHIEAPGKHTVKLAGKGLAYAGTVQALKVDLVPGADWPDNLNIALAGVTLLDTTTKASVGLDVLRLHVSNDANAAGLQISMMGQAMNVPKALNLPLGNAVQSFDIEMTVKDPLTPQDLVQNIGKVLPAWQQRGNSIDIQRFNLHSGPLVVSSSGTMTVDEALQPTAAFTAKIEGLFQVLEILRLERLITPSNAAIATMALSALSKRPTGGGPAYINLSVTIAGGQLKLGPVPVLDMPHFDWGIVAPPEAPEEVAPPPRNYKDVAPVF